MCGGAQQHTRVWAGTQLHKSSSICMAAGASDDELCACMHAQQSVHVLCMLACMHAYLPACATQRLCDCVHLCACFCAFHTHSSHTLGISTSRGRVPVCVCMHACWRAFCLALACERVRCIMSVVVSPAACAPCMCMSTRAQEVQRLCCAITYAQRTGTDLSCLLSSSV